MPEDRRRRHAKFCKESCKIKSDSETYGWSITRIGELPPSTVGAIGEFLVGCDLMKFGATVFRAMSPASECDLVAIKDGIIRRVEVRTGYRGVRGGISFPKKKNDKDRCDFYAVVIHGEDLEIIYMDTNGQTKEIKWFF